MTFRASALVLLLVACGGGRTADAPAKASAVRVPKDFAELGSMCELEACLRTCESGDATACVVAGYRYDSADGAPHDPARALSLYTKGCDAHVALGCYGAGTIHEDGSVAKPDAARAVSLYAVACDAAIPKACNDLGRLTELGQGVPKDIARATALYRAACDASHASGGCNRLGLVLSRGRGVAKDVAKATALFEAGCDANDWAACTNLAVELEQSGATVRAKDLFDRACKAGRVRRVIRADDMTACLDLGIGLRTSDPRAAAELFGAACDAGLDKACGRLGLLLVEGRGVTADAARGAKLLERACDGGDGSACNNLARSYYKGVGVTADRERARALWKKACSLGDEVGCSNAEGEARSR